MGALLQYATLIAAVLAVGMGLSGCQTVRGGPDRLYSIEEERSDARDGVLPRALAGYYAHDSSEGERMFFRNEYLARRMYIIDLEYTQYEGALTRERQQFGFGSAVVAQGLSAAGAVFTPASTVRVLSALTSGVNASRGFYDSELLLTKTVQIAQGHMRAQRDRIASEILLQRQKSIVAYPLSAALQDLEEYYRAGTITAGLIEAVGTAGDEAQVAAGVKAEAQGIVNPDTPLAPPLPRRSLFVDAPQPADVRTFQASLCVAVDGKVGPELLRAAESFVIGRDGASPRLTAIGRGVESLLREAVDFVPACRGKGFRNAFEVGAFGVPVGKFSPQDRVKEIQGTLNIPPTGSLDATTRTTIIKYRQDNRLKPELGDAFDDELRRKLFR
jgi:peptidoglycan hydrolase-like protein with peptidoglycan-binding domain